jgi:formate dehydrogenase subunit gamma
MTVQTDSKNPGRMKRLRSRYTGEVRWVPRYTTLERFLHWAHTGTFLLLAVTGIVLFMPAFAPLAHGEAGQLIRLMHRAGGVLFALVPILYAVLSPGRLVQTVKDMGFDRSDIDWLKNAWGYYILGKKKSMPPQGRWNTGEKLNMWLLVGGTIVFSITGFLMWFAKGILPVELFRASVILHDLAMIVCVNMFIVHFYLAVMHPLMWQSLVSMRFGVVSESYAREHHGKWYAQHDEQFAREMEKAGHANAAHANAAQGEGEVSSETS